jgi:hypothetical protein
VIGQPEPPEDSLATDRFRTLSTRMLHSLAHRDNQIAFLARAARFLEKALGK